MAGGFIASCRNPVSNAFVKRNAAVGGISYALDLGAAILAARPGGGRALIDAIVRHTRGAILAEGPAKREARRYTDTAHDVGRFAVGGATLHLMNEWMAVEVGGTRAATFPDVITTLDTETGAPVSAGRIRDGQILTVLRIPASEVPLAPALKDPALYAGTEAALGIPIVPFLPR
jgi:hypothetical protein